MPPILGLFLCNIMWSTAYVASKLLLAHYDPLEVSFFRIASAALAVLAVTFPDVLKWIKNPKSKLDLRLLLLGAVTFFASPLLQFNGVRLSRAVDTSMLIGFEPLATILLAVVFLRERLAPRMIVSLILAIIGVWTLSDVDFHQLSSTRLTGNLIFVCAMFSEGAYSVISKPLLDRRSPNVVMTVALFAGMALLFSANLAVNGPERLAGIGALTRTGTLTDLGLILWLGAACTGFGYFYWMKILPHLPLPLMAITLYLQPILGMFWGHLFLGETITKGNLIGASMIAAAVAVATVRRA